MNSKNTWLWLSVAAGLFAFIFFFERHLKKPETGPPRVLPTLQAKEITSLQILPKGQLAIRVERTNGVWHLTEPLSYPAQAARVEGLLTALQQITGAPYFSIQDLKKMPNADEQFGFDSPQFSLMLGQKRYHVLIGRKTPIGDQVYVEVVGSEGVFVVDADLLKFIPQSANDWRETALVDWTQIGFNHLIVTNAGKILELQLSGTNGRWRMISPMESRGDSAKVVQSLRASFQNLHVQQFVSDDPKADLDAFGLQTPELSLVFLAGTNSLVHLDFGRSPTNNPALAYARRGDQNTIVTVPKTAFEDWSFSHSHDFRDFLDPHLLALSTPPELIEIHADDHFILQRESDNNWRVLPPQDFLADSNLVAQVLANLTNLQVTASQIEKEIVPAAELPKYGLAEPFRQYMLQVTNPAEIGGLATNILLAQLDFGTNQDKLFARVPGERFVYSLPPATLNLLPSASWQMRDRRIWNFSETNVSSVTIRQNSRTRQLLRKGNKEWTLAPGSTGMIDEIVSAQIEESIHRLGDLSAAYWVQRGDQNSEAYGIQETAHQITIELQSGEKRSVAFGKAAPSQFPYASVALNGVPWIFEFPWTTYQFVQLYLTIPPNAP